jgi:hypothetical protein
MFPSPPRAMIPGHGLAPRPAPPRGGQPATLEGHSSFRVRTVALSRPAEPARAHPNMVVLTGANGDIVVYPPSEKLAILAARRRSKIA